MDSAWQLSRNGLCKWIIFLFQDVNVLKDIVDNVSDTIPSRMSFYVEEDDDDEKLAKMKAQVQKGIVSVLNILCVWDCANIWIRISEFLAFLVFDPFTELFITLAIVVNVGFMTLDHYNIQYDAEGGM